MLKIITLFAGILLCSFDVYAQQLSKEDCSTTLGKITYYEMLESTCGFNGKVSRKLKQTYDSGGCNIVLSRDKSESIKVKIIDETIIKYNEVKQDKFCNDVRWSYNDLAVQK